MTELLARARTGEVCELPLSLHGPPRAVLHLRAFPLFDGDTPLGAVVFVHDVSEIHRVESVRRDFVANVSHELKTPIGALGLLAETLAAETKPKVIHPLAERIVQEAERLGRIVDDLLDLSLIETQEAPTRKTASVRRWSTRRSITSGPPRWSPASSCASATGQAMRCFRARGARS